MKKIIASILITTLLTGCSLSLGNIQGSDNSGKTTEEKSTSVDAGSSVTGSKVKYTLAYDDQKWMEETIDEESPAEYSFAHVDGDVYAMVIAERLTFGLDSLKKIALENAQSLDPNAKITMEEKRKVNGVEVLAMQIEGTMDGIGFIYYGYYFTGKLTSIQLVTYTNTDLFAQYEDELTEFLNGLQVDSSTILSELELQENEEINITDGLAEGSTLDYKINYDPQKWSIENGKASDEYEYFFSHADGDVYAMVIPERLTVDKENMKKLALENAKTAAPDAKITFEETRKVNGKDMTVLKIAGTIEGIKFQYYGYYYTGKTVTIQFLAYTTTDLFDQYEKDLTDLLNSLEVTE
jgi:hypothetical protein